MRDQEDRLVGGNEVREILGGIHQNTLYRWLRDNPDFPKPFKLGGRLLWKRSAIDDYLDVLAAGCGQ